MRGHLRDLLLNDIEACPRCEYNDKVESFRENSQITTNVKNWFNKNTNYTSEQLVKATHYCDRCRIVFKMVDCQ
jgi:hypothetical protein